MPRPIRRRDFLKAAAVLSTGVWLGGSTEARPDTPNDKLNLAVIGFGAQGGVNLHAVGGENIVALCDVDDVRAGKAYETFPKAKKFYDFRKMLDEMESKIDGVVISTPDHTHFHPAHGDANGQARLPRKADGPLGLGDARKLTKLAAEKKVATQLGVQRHTLPSIHKAVELIQAGAIGTVKEVHSWVGGDRGMPALPKDTLPIPDTLKWDLWLGPAAERPYSPEYVPYKWRFWWDFGTGETGNWGCHILDIPFWALGLKYPTKVEASGPEPDAKRTPKTMATKFEFPAEGKRPALTLHWYHGTPPILKKEGLKGDDMNNLFIGSEGMLLCGFNSVKLLPGDKFKDYKEPKATLPKSPGFHKEWFAACKGGKAASCNFDYTGPMTETVLLGNVAFRAGGFDWDADKLKVGGNTKAEPLLRLEFRKGWEI